VKATDQLTEVQSAKRVPPVVHYLERTWPSIPLIVTTVGYSSTSVADLLGRAGAVLEFNEETFASQLRTRVVELLAKQEQANDQRRRREQPSVDPTVIEALKNISNRLDTREKSPASVDPALVKTLEQISTRLNQLEETRKDDIEKIAQTFSERTRQFAEPRLQEREIRSKWDVLEELERLERTPHSPISRDEERQIIRRVLVSNEALLKNKYLDELGGIYLDLLSPRRFNPSQGHVLDDLILEMRRALRSRSLVNQMMDTPWKSATLAGAPAAILYAIARIILHHGIKADLDWFSVTWIGLAIGAVVWSCSFLTLYLLKRRRVRSWSWRTL